MLLKVKEIGTTFSVSMMRNQRQNGAIAKWGRFSSLYPGNYKSDISPGKKASRSPRDAHIYSLGNIISSIRWEADALHHLGERRSSAAEVATIAKDRKPCSLTRCRVEGNIIARLRWIQAGLAKKLIKLYDGYYICNSLNYNVKMSTMFPTNYEREWTEYIWENDGRS